MLFFFFPSPRLDDPYRVVCLTLRHIPPWTGKNVFGFTETWVRGCARVSTQCVNLSALIFIGEVSVQTSTPNSIFRSLAGIYGEKCCVEICVRVCVCAGTYQMTSWALCWWLPLFTRGAHETSTCNQLALFWNCRVTPSQTKTCLPRSWTSQIRLTPGFYRFIIIPLHVLQHLVKKVL